MATLFLIVIYAAFISLGLPDGLLGTAWPVMQPEFGVSFGTAGLISMLISGCTIISSLMSGRVTSRFGTGKVTLVSVLLTAMALLGISFAPSFFWLALLALPLGLGAGAVDSGLNAYVAAHYKSHHMSWLHCFWGIGAMTGPIIMSRSIAALDSWRSGYLIVTFCQGFLVLLLFATLPVWDKVAKNIAADSNRVQAAPAKTAATPVIGPDEDDRPMTIRRAARIRGVKLALTVFFFYCAIESSVGLWGSSFLINHHGLDAAQAAGWVSLYYGSITLGRFITGFLTLRISDKRLIRAGEIVVLIGIVLFVLPLPLPFVFASLFLIGLGCAPVFPCMLHQTPAHFGRRQAPFVMGMQMAAAYLGVTVMPPLLGLAANIFSISLMPFFLVAYIFIMLAGSEGINRRIRQRDFTQN